MRGGPGTTGELSTLAAAASSAETLTELYPVVQRLRGQLDHFLEEFETQTETSKSIKSQQTLGSLNSQFGRTVASLQFMLHNQSSTLSQAENTLWKRRVDKLASDVQNFRTSFDKHLGHLYRDKIAEDERRRLIPGGSSSVNEDGTANWLRERDKLAESKRMIDNILIQGTETVDRLVLQNKTLKSAQRRLLDIGSSVGVTSSLMGILGRRHAVDRWMVYGLILSSFVILFALYSFVHTGSILGFIVRPS